jgi:hypothetical protein
VRKPGSNFLLVVTLVLAAAVVAFVIWRNDKSIKTERVGFQDANRPLLMPESGVPDPRFQFVSAWRRAQIPVAYRFDSPLGAESGAFTEQVMAFSGATVDAPQVLGDDLTGIGGGGVSLGDPVFSAADGLVLVAGAGPQELGNVILIGHVTCDGTPLQTLYAHLDRVEVAVGSLVARGLKIGSVGTAGGRYPPRLHFQIRRGTSLEIGGKTAEIAPDRLDPAAALARFRGADAADLAPSVLAVALAVDDEAWTALEIQNAELLSRLLGREDDSQRPETGAQPEPTADE